MFARCRESSVVVVIGAPLFVGSYNRVFKVFVFWEMKDERWKFGNCADGAKVCGIKRSSEGGEG
jgi:hypothetical protein